MPAKRLVGVLALLLLDVVAQTAPAAGTDARAVDSAHIPREPTDAVMAWVGQYGPEDSLLTIYEEHGELYADGRGLHRARLQSLGSTMTLVRDHGRPAAIRWDHQQLPRIDVGELVVQRIRSGARSDAAGLRAAALRQTPPDESGPRRPSDLVDLSSDPSIRFDIRYATTDNFMGFALYERPGAYLQRPAAEALSRVARRVGGSGFGLLVYDAYRPWFVTRMFWDATPDSAHVFVADPAEGSRHNRGCAVDLTLYRRSNGEPVPMTGRYDEMSLRSYPDFLGGTSEQRGYRDLLRRAMEAEGFTVYAEEWWHFDYKDWDQYAIGNLTFDQLQTRDDARWPDHRRSVRTGFGREW